VNRLAPCVLVLALSAAGQAGAAEPSSAMKSLADVYDRIASTLLAAKHAETAVVTSIIQHEHEQAQAALERAAGGGTADDLRAAAEHVGNIATEGGATVEPIRRRLLEGGVHHNADDTGPDATYDEGYVIVTKKQKQALLDLAKRCARQGESGRADAAQARTFAEELDALVTRILAGA
jgi:hypothetical protein